MYSMYLMYYLQAWQAFLLLLFISQLLLTGQEYSMLPAAWSRLTLISRQQLPQRRPSSLRVQSHLVSSSWRTPCTPRTRTPRSGSRSPRRRTRGTAACWPPPPWRCPAAVRSGAAALCWYSHCGRWWTRWWRSTAGCRARRASSCSAWSRPAMQCPHFKTPKMQENIQSVLINIYSWLLDIWDVWSWVTELHFVIVNFCIISYFSF